jgi:hypothetical protein
MITGVCWGAVQSGATRDRKGCDIGYALATNSCEEVDSVDACTVTALDAITAFAVPNPNCLLAEVSRFFRVWLLVRLPFRANHPAYFRSATFYFRQPFQPSTRANLNTWFNIVNASFQCKTAPSLWAEQGPQSVESSMLDQGQVRLCLFFHRIIHSGMNSERWLVRTK